MDAIKEPVILEFLGLRESNKLVESELEEALINNLQQFLLELGKGFSFIGRQKRLTFDGDPFYADLILIRQLNQKIIGWTNYYKGGVSSKVFAKIDFEIYSALINWCLKRQARKGKHWISRKYVTTLARDNWRFHCTIKDKEGNKKTLYLKRATDTHIRRHIKVKAEANPF